MAISGYKISKEQEQYVINLYKKDITINDIIKLCNIKKSTLYRVLRRNNIIFRKPNINIHLKRKERKLVHENYFQVIDTEEKGYFLGLLYADGYIANTFDSFSISLQEEDKLILERFSLALCNRIHLKYKEKSKETYKNQYMFRIYNDKICKDLNEIGCTPNKSLTLKYPNLNTFKNDDIERAFIRGYLDGDGTINKKTKFNTYTVGFTSTKFFLNSLKERINKFTGIDFKLNKSDIHRNNITASLKRNDNVIVHDFLSWLYKDANIYLNRKYDKYIEIKNYLNSDNAHIVIKLTIDQEKDIVSKYIDKKRLEDIEEEYGIHKGKIYTILNKYNVELRGHPKKEILSQ